MHLKMLKSKIHQAKVTGTDLDYEGSITVDEELLEASGILAFEQVQVANLNNGVRFETYVLPGVRGSGVVNLNGAAARLAVPGDLVIIMAYAWCSEEEVRGWAPRVVLVDGRNRIAKVLGVAGHTVT